ncbi:MAG: hypothetical protein ACFCBV_03285, partial [Phycisphaerales bacterium]
MSDTPKKPAASVLVPETTAVQQSGKPSPELLDSITKHLESNYVILPRRAVKFASAVIVIALVLGFGTTALGLRNLAKQVAESQAKTTAGEIAEETVELVMLSAAEEAERSATKTAEHVAQTVATETATPLSQQLARKAAAEAAAEAAPDAAKAAVNAEIVKVLPQAVQLVTQLVKPIVASEASAVVLEKSQEYVDQWLSTQGHEALASRLRELETQATSSANSISTSIERVQQLESIAEDGWAPRIDKL